jgi:hypothetical protein
MGHEREQQEKDLGEERTKKNEERFISQVSPLPTPYSLLPTPYS